MCNELEGLHGKITIVQHYIRKRDHLFVAIGMVTAIVDTMQIATNLWYFSEKLGDSYLLTYTV